VLATGARRSPWRFAGQRTATLRLRGSSQSERIDQLGESMAAWTLRPSAGRSGDSNGTSGPEFHGPGPWCVQKSDGDAQVKELVIQRPGPCCEGDRRLDAATLACNRRSFSFSSKRCVNALLEDLPPFPVSNCQGQPVTAHAHPSHDQSKAAPFTKGAEGGTTALGCRDAAHAGQTINTPLSALSQDSGT